MIAKLNVGNFVKLLGWQEKSTVLEVINNADVFLAPSVTSRNGDQEGIPVSLMEAMAVGLPVISTWHSGVSELIYNTIILGSLGKSVKILILEQSGSLRYSSILLKLKSTWRLPGILKTEYMV